MILKYERGSVNIGLIIAISSTRSRVSEVGEFFFSISRVSLANFFYCIPIEEKKPAEEREIFRFAYVLNFLDDSYTFRRLAETCAHSLLKMFLQIIMVVKFI